MENLSLTFKEYLDSKKQLEEALQKTPHVTLEYVVYKYCTLTVGEDKSSKESITLKPKQELIIEWAYFTPNKPTPISVTIDHQLNESAISHVPFLDGHKLSKWLIRNTQEKQL